MSQLESRGLSAEQVRQRMERGEANHVARSARAEYAEILSRNFVTLFNALVVPAAVALFLLQDYRGAASVSGLAIVNTALGLVQEIRAKRHLDRLALLGETRVRVVRDGATVEIPGGDVVRDDLVFLAAGDSVVADGVLLEVRFLEIDEALLTGESDPVPRRLGDRIQSGSFVVAGEGRYVADRVGKSSYIQQTATEASRYRFLAGPLQTTIHRLIRILTTTAIVLCTGYLLLWMARGFPLADLVQMMAATITSMIPQGLVLMTTLAFVLGAVRMGRRGAIVQRLDSVETMAVIDTLCMDKTGTLTTNNLRLERLIFLSRHRNHDEVRRLLQLFAATSVDQSNKNLAAIRAALGSEPAQLVDQLPFKAHKRYSAIRVLSNNDIYTLFFGAPEALQPFLSPFDKAAVEASRLEWVPTGFRLLFFAESTSSRNLSDSLDDDVLAPLALVAFRDELRPEAANVLCQLAGQGIDFKVLSGDNPDTVRATMSAFGEFQQLRSLAVDPVASGPDLETDKDVDALIAARRIFGRVAPWQKVRIIDSLKAAGRQVAMIGDGVNDVLSIKNANLGIAMGDGSSAARAVAGVVLATNGFDLLPAILDEGRTILRNLRRAGKLFLVKNVYVLILIVGTLGVFHMAFPFLQQQVTLLNFLTIGVPALLITLSTEPAPAPKSEFLWEVGWFTMRTGILVGAGVLALQWHSARIRGEDAHLQRTLVLTALVLSGLITLVRALRDGEYRELKGDWKFYTWCAVALPLYVAVMYLSPLAYFFDLVALTGEQWVRVLLAVTITALLCVFSDRLRLRAPA